MSNTSALGQIAIDSASRRPELVDSSKSLIDVEGLNFYYGDFQALQNVNMQIMRGKVTAFIGPSGCGKSTFLRTINRMNDTIDGTRVEGLINFDGQDIYDKNVDVVSLRQHVGMVFQRPNPFPMSIYDNVAFGPRLSGVKDKKTLDQIVERCLRNAALWEETKDRLQKSALGMSGGQQQRLCIARAIANEPKVLLLDEPASALDPNATAKIEDLIFELRGDYTIVIVTHNMQQAARVSDRTCFFLKGEVLECGDTQDVFTRPQHPETEAYITGRFG
ncbi:MAG: phosphate ABC transporter ATP-binding protein [Planctomycetes bacterium]|nr:phosphate ABC transporter ATP-binding protein [Planctomycetota bacterium]